MTKLAVDKNQFAGTHGQANAEIHMRLKDYGIELVPAPIPFGDYVLLTDDMEDTIERRGDKLKKMDLVGDIKVSVDLKAGGLDEVAMNIQGKEHNRFRDEAILAKKCGCLFYVLVVDETIRTIDDVALWRSKRKASQVNPVALSKAMRTMWQKYSINWIFCSRENTARAIMYLLTGVDFEQT